MSEFSNTLSYSIDCLTFSTIIYFSFLCVRKDGQMDVHHEPNTSFTEIYVEPDIVHSVIYSMDQSPSREGNMFSVVSKFPATYGIRRSITAVTSARHLYLYLSRSVHDPSSHFLKIHLNSEPALYTLLTFHVPKIIFQFRCTILSVQAWGLLIHCFVTHFFLMWGFVSSSPNSKSGRTPLVDYPRPLIQYIRSYFPYWAVPPSANWRRGMSWRQEPTCGGQIVIIVKYINCTDLRWLDSVKQYW